MSDQAQVEQALEDYVAALAHGDAVRCSALSNQTVQYHQALFLLITFHSYTISDLAVAVNGAVATATFSATFDATLRGVRSTQTATQTWTLFKSHGTWRINVPLAL